MLRCWCHGVQSNKPLFYLPHHVVLNLHNLMQVSTKASQFLYQSKFSPAQSSKERTPCAAISMFEGGAEDFCKRIWSPAPRTR